MNFFEWIRDSVRRAVLLGVSDAVEDLGTPDDKKNAREQLLKMLRDGRARASGGVGSSPKRKRLGRTFSETQAGQATPQA